MKRIIILTTAVLALLAGCANSQQKVTAAKSVPTHQETEDDSAAVSGSYSYYLELDDSLAPYKQSALNRVCFEPAQLETINGGQMFCFTNTQEALNLFGYHPTNEECKHYGGVAAIRIKKLTNKNLSDAKSDPCVEKGTCDFNEAELVSIVESGQSAPKCFKKQSAQIYKSTELDISFQYPSSLGTAWENKYKGTELLAVKFLDKNHNPAELELVPAGYDNPRTCNDILANGFYAGDSMPSDCETLTVDGHKIIVVTFGQTKFVTPSKDIHFETKRGVWKFSTTDKNRYEEIVNIAKTLRYLR